MIDEKHLFSTIYGVRALSSRCVAIATRALHVISLVEFWHYENAFALALTGICVVSGAVHICHFWLFDFSKLNYVMMMMMNWGIDDSFLTMKFQSWV